MKKYTFCPVNRDILQLLYIDSLTSVYNRRYYDEHFQGTDNIQAMVIIDVDDFKHINDNYGHDVWRYRITGHCTKRFYPVYENRCCYPLWRR